MEYINKKWDLPTMEKKVELLKKIIPPGIVNWTLDCNLAKTDSRLDALYLTFYDLKDRYCKIKRRTFGKPKYVDYEPKRTWIGEYTNTPVNEWYTLYATTSATVSTTLSNSTASAYTTTTWSPSDYIWTVSTNSIYR